MNCELLGYRVRPGKGDSYDSRQETRISFATGRERENENSSYLTRREGETEKRHDE